MTKQLYLDIVLEQIPRLLGLLDKNPLSKTYGCFDREFWHYAVTDTPSARKQEAVLTLALLYSIKHPKNPYYKSEQILEFIKASLTYWQKIQEKNSSFNEWYPKEHSFVATSFSLYAITETILILNLDIPKINQAILKATRWLINKKEERVLNQEAGSILALYNVYLLTKKERLKQLIDKKIENFIKNQNSEGWFLEYGGADIGYLSLTIDYLSKLWKKSKNNNLLRTLKKSCEFLSYFIHPDFTFGGIYGSRNTEYLIPHGLELLSDKDENALLLSSAIKQSLKKNSFPTNLDDRYLCQILYTWLQAYIDYSGKSSKKYHFKKSFIKNFPEAGIYIFNNPNFYFITNYKKAGVFRLFLKKQNKQAIDSGMFIKRKKKIIQSSWLNASKFEIEKNTIKIRGNFVNYKQNQITPIKYFLLRLFQLTFGRNGKISLFIKNLLRKFLITGNKYSNSQFQRKISIQANQIEIIDDIISPHTPYWLYQQGKVENIYVPSSNYFNLSDLDSNFTKKTIDKSHIIIKRIFSK